MHPLFEEICRAPGVSNVQAHCFNRWQRQLRDEIQPLLDELDRLRAEQAQAETVTVADTAEAETVKVATRRSRA